VIFDGKLRANVTSRMDKNENFDLSLHQLLHWYIHQALITTCGLASPPGYVTQPLSDQFLSLNVGPATLAGNLNGADSVITLQSFQNYLEGFLQRDLLEYYDIDPIRPEQVRTIEAGYRGTLVGKTIC
jgi:iron complex outermembrane receptor protein